MAAVTPEAPPLTTSVATTSVVATASVAIAAVPPSVSSYQIIPGFTSPSTTSTSSNSRMAETKDVIRVHLDPFTRVTLTNSFLLAPFFPSSKRLSPINNK
jgi:hypothetical protein